MLGSLRQAVGWQAEGIKKVCASMTARFTSPRTARSMSGRAAVPKFALVKTPTHVTNRAWGGGVGTTVLVFCLSVCVRICASAQTEKPLAPGGVHTP